jgi:hypothetical protein
MSLQEYRNPIIAAVTIVVGTVIISWFRKKKSQELVTPNFEVWNQFLVLIIYDLNRNNMFICTHLLRPRGSEEILPHFA